MSDFEGYTITDGVQANRMFNLANNRLFQRWLLIRLRNCSDIKEQTSAGPCRVIRQVFEKAAYNNSAISIFGGIRPLLVYSQIHCFVWQGVFWHQINRLKIYKTICDVCLYGLRPRDKYYSEHRGMAKCRLYIIAPISASLWRTR